MSSNDGSSRLDEQSKSHRLQRFLAFHGRPDTNSLKSAVRLFEPDRELQQIEHKVFLRDPNLYVEEHGTYLWVKEALRRCKETKTPAGEPWVVFGFNMAVLASPYFPAAEVQRVLDALEKARQAAKPHALSVFSCFDFALKPVVRTTQPEILIHSGDLDLPVERWAGVHEEVLIIHFESVRDLSGHGTAIFPLIPLRPCSPQQGERPYLYAFHGTYGRPNWPPGFVRSPDRRGFWETLEHGEKADVCVLEAASPPASLSATREAPLQSVFTLCPRGIAGWSFRLYEAILCGSIPVLLSDHWVPPFAQQLDWDAFSLRVLEKDLWRIDERIRAVSAERIVTMQRALADVQNCFSSRGLLELITRQP